VNRINRCRDRIKEKDHHVLYRLCCVCLYERKKTC